MAKFWWGCSWKSLRSRATSRSESRRCGSMIYAKDGSTRRWFVLLSNIPCIMQNSNVGRQISFAARPNPVDYLRIQTWSCGQPLFTRSKLWVASFPRRAVKQSSARHRMHLAQECHDASALTSITSVFATKKEKKKKRRTQGNTIGTLLTFQLDQLCSSFDEIHLFRVQLTECRSRLIVPVQSKRAAALTTVVEICEYDICAQLELLDEVDHCEPCLGTY